MPRARAGAAVFARRPWHCNKVRCSVPHVATDAHVGRNGGIVILAGDPAEVRDRCFFGSSADVSALRGRGLFWVFGVRSVFYGDCWNHLRRGANVFV